MPPELLETMAARLLEREMTPGDETSNKGSFCDMELPKSVESKRAKDGSFRSGRLRLQGFRGKATEGTMSNSTIQLM